MKQKSGPGKAPAEQVLKDIRRQTRRQYSAEEKIRIVLEGLRGEENISELCRREGIAASMYYGWSKEFLEAGKRRLAGDTARAATSGEVKDLRRQAQELKAVVVVGRYADVHHVFSDTETFKSEMPRGAGWEQFNKIMFAQFVTQMDGEQPARVRRLLIPAFSSRSIEQLQESITRIIDGMLDRIEAKGPEFDGMQDYGAHLVVDALLDAMVNMDQRRKAIFVAFHRMIPGTTYVKPGESWSPGLRTAFDRTMEEVKAIIEERRVSPRSDFISDLVNARDQGDKLSDSELFDQIFGICGASLSATSRAAGGALHLLYTHPAQLEQLIHNPALIADALEECLSRHRSRG